MKLRFWGVRGSIPTPGPETARYGGNTTCLQVSLDGGRQVVFDAGTGIRPLGGHLMTLGGPVKADLFITHTHWDHIQGFPFFIPIYVPVTELHVRGPAHWDEDKTLEHILAQQMDYNYFPVPFGALKAGMHFEGLKEGDYEFDGYRMEARVMNHPVINLGYRLEADGGIVVFTGDHEPFYDTVTSEDSDDEEREEVAAAVAEANGKVAALCRDADLMVCDAQYTPDDYEAHRGWGHSSWKDAVDLAARAGAKRLAFTHHAPERSDEALAAIEEAAVAYAASVAAGLEVFAAREGREVEL